MRSWPSITRWHVLAACGIYLLASAWVITALIRPDVQMVLSAFWASGEALTKGLDPYGQHPLTPIVGSEAFPIADINLNPPSLLPAFQLLARADLHVAARAWVLASAVLYLLAMSVLAMKGGSRVQLAWATLLPMFVDTLGTVQIYVVLFLCGAAAALAFRGGRPALAGVALGVLVAMKPNFALALLALAAAGQMRVLVPAALTAAVLSGLPALLYGPEVYGLWLAAAASDLHWVFPTEASVPGYLGRLGARPLGLGLAATLAVLVLAAIRRRRPPAEEAVRIGLLLSILCSPLAWYHYLLVVVPFMLGRRWTRAEWAGAALLFVPPSVVLAGAGTSPLGLAVFGGLYVAGALALLGGRLAALGAPSAGTAAPEGALVRP